MRSVGCMAGFKGVAMLLASLTFTCAALARTPDITDLPVNMPHVWDRQLPDDEAVAQQTPAPAPVPAAPPPAQSAPTGNAATPDAPAPAVNQAPDQPASPVPPETTPTEPATGDVLPDLSPEAQESEDFSVGEIPTVETVELTPETARKAMDAYVMVREKYKDAALENYENLQDFVEQDSHGKAFDADIKGYGFATANDWNTAITTVGFAYSNLIDDQTADLRQQIEEVKNDSEMAQDMRDRMVQALNAMIPSDNNRKVVEDMSKDPVYAEKLKALETEEE